MSSPDSRNAMAASATMHCPTGCAVGEVLGLLIGTATGLSNSATILAVALAFLFGYALPRVPVLSTGVPANVALTVVLAADIPSIATMEAVDNAVMALGDRADVVNTDVPFGPKSLTIACIGKMGYGSA